MKFILVGVTFCCLATSALVIPSITEPVRVTDELNPHMLETFDQLTTTDPFVVTSYNMYGLMPAITWDNARTRSVKIAQLVIQNKARYGLFQENWCNYGKDFDLFLHDRLYQLHRIRDIESQGSAITAGILSNELLDYFGLYCKVNTASGLTIVSSYTLSDLQIERFDFQNCSRFDCLVEKSIVCGKSVQDNVRICTTHLQSGGKRSEGIRASQIHSINLMLQRFPGEALIVGGDLNICVAELRRPKDADAKKLAWLINRQDLLDAHAHLDTESMYDPLGDGEEEFCRKDFLLYRGLTLLDSSINFFDVSDHPELKATFVKY